MPQTETSRHVSDMIVWAAIFFSLLAIERMIFSGETLEISRVIRNLFMFHLTLGSVIIHHKKILPEDTNLLKAGKIDLRWGLRAQYWAAWWPYLVSKKT